MKVTLTHIGNYPNPDLEVTLIDPIRTVHFHALDGPLPVVLDHPLLGVWIVYFHLDPLP